MTAIDIEIAIHIIMYFALHIRIPPFLLYSVRQHL